MLSVLVFLAGLTGAANVHFHLLYPETRGPLISAQEPEFCGGYNATSSTRAFFPLSGSLLNINTSHIHWTVLVSISNNATSFDNFLSDGEQLVAASFTEEHSNRTFCLPFDIAAVNIPAVTTDRWLKYHDSICFH
ncbi:hypothetical protein BDQ12DRAFT_647389 [Crucibulum laeve]|uniref:Copper acquisition factor BIM1-like domain-containing protein n=1 Tax=Crucibulum laeve TaxID=68775 RepID=A0A5C3M9R2_9AGAR|nr:hypothetical protein BDQ12DRAFT_647389 [Crucibulum laeve]